MRVSGLFNILLLAAFFNGLSWIILIPVWQYPDEQSHFAQVQDIAEIGNTPSQGSSTSLEIVISENLLDTERDGLGNNKFTYQPYHQLEYTNTNDGLYEKFIEDLPRETRTSFVKFEATQNPPLYYIMAANFYRMQGNASLFSRIFAVRFFSLLLYLSIVLISINASKLLFARNKSSKTILPAIIAFSPMLVFSTTGVLPDPLTILFFTAIFAICLKVIKSGVSIQPVALLAILNYLGIHTRQQFQIAIPISLIVMLYGAYQATPQNKKKIFWLSLGIIILSSGTYIKLNPAIVAIPELGIPNTSLILSSSFFHYLMSTLKHYYTQTLPWYWGVYKWLSLTAPHIYYQTINRLIAVSALGLIIRGFFILKNNKLEKVDLMILFFIISIIIYTSVFIIWDFYFQRLYGYPFGIQGRYFLPLVFPVTSIIIYGIMNLMKFFSTKYQLIVKFILVLFFILFNDASLSFVASSYYKFDTVRNIIAQISQYKPYLLKGDIIIIILGLALLIQVAYMFILFKSLFKNEQH